jgi:hypothetical protein
MLAAAMQCLSSEHAKTACHSRTLATSVMHADAIALSCCSWFAVSSSLCFASLALSRSCSASTLSTCHMHAANVAASWTCKISQSLHFHRDRALINQSCYCAHYTIPVTVTGLVNALHVELRTDLMTSHKGHPAHFNNTFLLRLPYPSALHPSCKTCAHFMAMLIQRTWHKTLNRTCCLLRNVLCYIFMLLLL